jgi:hypothetical protein
MTPATWIEPLENRIGHWAIPHITKGIVLLNALLFLLIGASPEFVQQLTMDARAVMHGEVWRIFTFALIPGTQHPLFIIFYLLFTWFVGNSLEQEWGSFKLNIYFLIGILSITAVSFIWSIRSIDNYYLYFSLLLAFGTAFPKLEIMLFPIPIPVQARFLAIFNAAWLLVAFIMKPQDQIIILASNLNYLLFFGPSVISNWITSRRSQKRMNAFRKSDED